MSGFGCSVDGPEGAADHRDGHPVPGFEEAGQAGPFPGGQVVCPDGAEHSAAGPVTRGIGAQSITTRASQTFEDAISRVRPAAESIVAQLRGLASAPDEVGVEFGLALSAEAGAFIAAASTAANFKVSLTWYRFAAPEAK